MFDRSSKIIRHCGDLRLEISSPCVLPSNAHLMHFRLTRHLLNHRSTHEMNIMICIYLLYIYTYTYMYCCFSLYYICIQMILYARTLSIYLCIYSFIPQYISYRYHPARSLSLYLCHVFTLKQKQTTSNEQATAHTIS